MRSVRLVINRKLFEELRYMPATRAAVDDFAEEAAQVADSKSGSPGDHLSDGARTNGRAGRFRASVRTATHTAVVSENQHRTLSKAVAEVATRTRFER